MALPAEIQLAVDKSLRAQNGLVQSTARLDKAKENSKANGLPPIAVSTAQGSYLSMLCQLMGAKSVLEIGTLGG
jgi:predicted O-methyltransferase YrrM